MSSPLRRLIGSQLHGLWPLTGRLARAALLLTACVSAGAAQASRGPGSLDSRLADYLEPWAEAGFLSGTVLVARGDSVLYERSFGWANHEWRIPMSPTTRVGVASVTKPMTIVVATRLVEEGKLHPDQTLAEFIPDFPRADRITVSHLLNHRATIPHRVTTPEQETVPRTAADMVEFARNAEPLPFEPGEQSVYSSGGFSVLARVLELAGDADYGTLLERYVFEPAGMTHSAHTDSRRVLPERASPYAWMAEGVVNSPLQDLSFLVGAGSVYSTPSDLFAMMRSLVNGGLGRTAQLALLRENGLSWNGSTSGFRAWAEWNRETDVTVILTANMQSGANDHLRRDLPRIVAGEEVVASVPEPPEGVAVPQEFLARYDGTYELRPGSPMEMRAADGGLWIGAWFLIPTSETTFFSPQDFGEIVARFGPDGALTHFDWVGAGGSVELKPLSPPGA